jgi:periplasmic protein TonB
MIGVPPVFDSTDAVAPAANTSSQPRKMRHDNATSERFLLPVTTLVLWLGCLTVGCLGIALPYARPQPPPKLTEPIQAEVLDVELSQEPLLRPDEPPPRPLENSEPPPLIQPMTPPEAPPTIAVAEPSPAIAFALPMEGPSRLVQAKDVSYARQVALSAPVVTPPPVQAITFGQGEGKQPAPEYPRQAVREGQEGNVTLRFSVGENGRVLAAEAVSGSSWPLLNEAALYAVRQRWRFRPGVVRLYEVTIRFELNK